MSAAPSPLVADKLTADPSGPGPSCSRGRVEYRKDGAISKMRSHRGNIPVLPQTKFCPHCPAKFTRTTHLNRHLRTHTGERLHRCDTCDAQFTRSDLLTRHKKTCGDLTLNRTRRRSCQACAESKVKCDLRQPCSKCQARGKECVFAVRSSRIKSSESLKDVPPTTPSESSVSPSTTSPSSTSTSPLEENTYGSFDWTPSPLPYTVPLRESETPNWSDSYSDGTSPAPSESISSSVGFASSSGSDNQQAHISPLYPTTTEPYFNNIFPGYTTNSNTVNLDRRSRINHTPSPISSVDETFPFTSQPIDIQTHPHLPAPPDSIFYDTSTHNSSTFGSTSLPERPRFVQSQSHYGSMFNVPQEFRQTEQDYYPYPRIRTKASSSSSAFESTRRPVPAYSDQLPRDFTLGSVDSSLVRQVEPKHRHQGHSNGSYLPQWDATSEHRAGVFEPMQQHAGHADVAYRHHCSDCYLDSLKSNASFIMRREMAGMDLA
ncbi:hypothetical protein BJ138DRAFT_808171 [Hygrophoropsis aurantiaca]|uniref:Uncharacterized protein n=1 Tax=Hygrophoropsis aurantiaca TaxID=72124 RepID=A0ACB8AGI0_9AGAM|nr:hypothetical protein BJ138DRAFT_808171 [Hygrophoropsis aurantiaca]